MDGAEDYVRPDIKAARAAMGRVKTALVYKDEDELDTGMQKVQPLPFLDEEILKFKDQIESSVSAARGNDDVPKKVLSKVEHVIDVATKGKTTLFKASELLEFTLEPFQYARRSALDTFDLWRKSDKILSDYDSSFSQMLSARLEANMDSALECEERCLQQLEMAVGEAESDCRRWGERSQEEETQLESVGKLDEVKSEVKESISEEISELEMIRDHCSKDVRSIDSEVNSFKTRMQKATSDYKLTEKANEKRLKENRLEQEDLRRRLATLEKEEKRLEMELASGQSQEREAEEAREKVNDEVKEWKAKIIELQNRAETALRVMREMSDVTELIVTDAQNKQQTMKEKLCKLELESLLAKRDVLMAQGVMYRVIESESHDNIKNIEAELADLQKQKRNAAKTGFRKKVEQITQNIDSYTVENTKYLDKSKKAKESLEGLSKELEVVDKKVKKLKPLLKLDKLEDRYKHRKSAMEKAFNTDTMEGVTFCSRGNYV